MYLRYTTVRKKGKVHTYWTLVRSVRQGRRVRQQVVAHLGELDARGRAKAKKLADWITGRRSRPTLFEPTDPETDERIEVRLKDVRLERARRFGDVFLGWTLWCSLRLDELLTRLLPAGREEVPWSTMAAVQVILRLCSPSSDLHIAEDLYRRTALEDLLGVPSELINDDRLYRALDQLLPHKAAIEKHLRNRLGELFDIRYDLLLYDVTSTYFEGLCPRNPQAQRGYSRDHRPDCKQVCIALVVTRGGIPLSYEVFDGNRADVTTVEEIVELVEGRWGTAERVWVMDRGMVSEENLEWLRAGGRRYLIGANKAELKRWEARIVEAQDWRRIREDIQVKLCQGPDGQETFILCRSQTRKAKDHAIVERFAKQLDERLSSLERRLERARKPVDRAQVERQIGRLLERTSRASGKYQILVEETSDRPSGLRLVIKENAAWLEWAQSKEGCYVLRTNVKEWTDEELWKTYIQLTQAEAAFRIEKTELSIRPVWHHREDRVQAHILVCFLAYVLWKTLEEWQSRAGLGNGPRTVLEELAQIQSADVVLPTVDGRDLRVRCVVRPAPSQAAILERLGLELPRRLRLGGRLTGLQNVVTTPAV
jgi:transposase